MYALTMRLLMLMGLLLTAPASLLANPPSRVVSLDYCADQYVLKLLPAENILAVSPDAKSPFSYMREAAHQVPDVRPIAEDIISLRPDLIVRTYGGGPNASHYFKKLGIPVLQIGYANAVQDIAPIVEEVANQLGVPEAGKGVTSKMNARMVMLTKHINQSALYTTPGGVTGGSNTLVDSIIKTAGYANYQTESGWQALPLEQLAHKQPDKYVTAFYEDEGNHINPWSAARHPVIKKAIGKSESVNLNGATTSCGGWFILDAVEKLANTK